MGVEVGGMSGDSGSGRSPPRKITGLHTKQTERHKNSEFKTSHLVHRRNDDDLTATGKSA